MTTTTTTVQAGAGVPAVNNPKIQERTDQQRGCGWRKEGGLYLISAGLFAPCGKMPIPLDRCPCCDAGVKFSRGWTWINLAKFVEKIPCNLPAAKCAGCPLAGPDCGAMGPANIERAGLLWIGEKFYTMDSFTEEAAKLGVSRRIHTLPRDFKVGETWVALAHISAVAKDCPDCGWGAGKCKLNADECETCNGEQFMAPGIFHLFKPTSVEYVVTGQESEQEIDAMIARGITPVRVTRKEGGQ